MSPAPSPELVTGEDGVPRCPWGASSAQYRDYHDQEWGRPVHGDQEIFERLSLEAFQSGLAWITILRKREAFRAAFDRFDPRLVAGYGPGDVERLMADAGIVRNRAKITATITNAGALLALQAARGPDALDRLVWSYRKVPRHRPRSTADIPATTPDSQALAKALRGSGFAFVGPTTAYAALQALGVVDDHLEGCAAART